MYRKFIELIAPYWPDNNRLERIWLFAKIDFRRRYYDSFLGLFWALINPLFKMGLYYLVFTILFSSQIENFALYIFVGLINWMFFSEISSKGIRLFRQKSYLIETIDFPREDIFISSTLSGVLGLLFNFGAFFLMLFLFGGSINVQILWLPVLLINLLIFTYSVSLVLGVFSIYLKDIDHLWDMLILAGFWSIPIFWDQNILFGEGRIDLLLYLNPITGIVTNMRYVLLEGLPPKISWLLYDLAYSFIFLLATSVFFKQKNHLAAEKI